MNGEVSFQICMVAINLAVYALTGSIFSLIVAGLCVGFAISSYKEGV